MPKKTCQPNTVSTAEAVSVLGCSVGAFPPLVKQYGLTGQVSHGRWDLSVLCKSIQNKMKRGKILENANRYLATSGAGKQQQKKERTPPHDKTPAPTPAVVPGPVHVRVPVAAPRENDDCLGLESAVVRLRTYEKMLADRFEREMEEPDGQGNVAGAYRDWIAAVEQMRKSESDLLEVLARRKQLVDVDAVKEWAVRMVETTKGLLLVMPTKLAGELEGMDWPDIQARLDAEIRDILTNLSACPDF